MKKKIIMEILMKDQMKKRRFKTFDRSLVEIGVYKFTQKVCEGCK